MFWVIMLVFVAHMFTDNTHGLIAFIGITLVYYLDKISSRL